VVAQLLQGRRIGEHERLVGLGVDEVGHGARA
jgi:hypothetical protein